MGRIHPLTVFGNMRFFQKIFDSRKKPIRMLWCLATTQKRQETKGSSLLIFFVTAYFWSNTPWASFGYFAPFESWLGPSVKREGYNHKDPDVLHYRFANFWKYIHVYWKYIHVHTSTYMLYSLCGQTWIWVSRISRSAPRILRRHMTVWKVITNVRKHSRA